MFTGLIQQIGRVASAEPNSRGMALRIDAGGWPYAAAAGDSVSVSGCCLTHAPDSGCDPSLRFDVILETLAKSTLGGLKPGDSVNLEHSATPSTLLGGHIVQGHVDGIGLARRVGAGADGEWRVRIVPPNELMDFIVPKGSVAIDGVSLTIAAVGDDWFEVALIPATLELTTLKRIDFDEGSVKVNVETDCMVKAVVHYLKRREGR